MQLLAVLARADLLLDSFDLEDRLQRTVLAEDLPANLAMVSAEEEAELCMALVARLCLLIRDPVWLGCRRLIQGHILLRSLMPRIYHLAHAPITMSHFRVGGSICKLAIDGEIHIDHGLDSLVYFSVKTMLNLLCTVVLGTAILIVDGKVHVLR